MLKTWKQCEGVEFIFPFGKNPPPIDAKGFLGGHLHRFAPLMAIIAEGSPKKNLMTNAMVKMSQAMIEHKQNRSFNMSKVSMISRCCVLFEGVFEGSYGG